MTPEEFIQLLGFVVNESSRMGEGSDVIIHIEADGSSKPGVAAMLYKKGFAPKVLITGETEKTPQIFRTQIIAKKMQNLGVPQGAIIVESVSTSSREQAVEFLKLAKKYNWKKAILAAPIFHAPRLYATFIKAINEAGEKIKIINYPIKALSWFKETEHGSRHELFKIELAKIKEYSQKGHIASLQEIIDYQKWKENQK